jgi:hypothetical protein
MSSRKLAIVVTTISKGDFLDAYAPALRSPPKGHEARMYVVGDLNTPGECAARAARLAEAGLPVTYLGVEEQDRLIAPFPELAAAIPYRSDARRNLGFLRALVDRCDVMISIDDDNLPLDGSFLEHHGAVGANAELPSVLATNGWLNLGEWLCAKDRIGLPVTVHPRGYPYKRRLGDSRSERGAAERGRVDINVGLWKGDPDVDAPTRLVTGVVAAPSLREPFFLARANRTPINTQNTAIAWHAIPGYWFVTMGAVLDGVRMDRFGDIFSGYFVQLCAEAVGGRVRIGPPVVEQIRNPHDLLKDLWCEMPALRLVEEMVELFEQPLTPARSYVAAYRELAERIASFAPVHKGSRWKDDIRNWLETTSRTMKLWADACETLAGAAALEV